MNPNHIRPIAICLFSHNGRVLAAEGYDPIKQQTFYRPLGGTIEFGETSAKRLRANWMKNWGRPFRACATGHAGEHLHVCRAAGA
ncbi:MAG: hypothetical protein R3C44_09860 [Chloroflexota bacterium]